MKSKEYVHDEAVEQDEENIDYGSYSDFVDYKELKNKRRFSYLRRKNIFLKIFLLIFLIFCAFLTPVFNVNNIVVVGNSILSEEKIIDASGIYISKNISFLQSFCRA